MNIKICLKRLLNIWWLHSVQLEEIAHVFIGDESLITTNICCSLNFVSPQIIFQFEGRDNWEMEMVRKDPGTCV